MSFSPDLRNAARRHLGAANILYPTERKDVAGYLYGVAAECAIKAMMIDAGFAPSDEKFRRDDPFYSHFPDLRSTMRDKLSGRKGTPLITFIFDDRFMSNWSTTMRYSNGNAIKPGWVKAWAEQATQVVASIGS